MVWRITVEWLDDEDSPPELVAHGRICHLDDRHSADRRDFHAYFEVEPNPRSSFDHPHAVHKLVGTAIIDGYPRYEGSIWDLVETALVAAGRGRGRDWRTSHPSTFDSARSSPTRPV